MKRFEHGLNFGLAMLMAAAMPEFDRNGGVTTAEWLAKECSRIAATQALPPDVERFVLEETLAQAASFFELWALQLGDFVTRSQFLDALGMVATGSLALDPLEVFTQEGN